METKAKILLIEDEDYIREIYKEELESSGFSVDDFPTGEQGLSAFKQNSYDLVVLDIVLPDISGLVILKTIKESNKNIPVLVLTNLDQDIVVKKALDLGATAYLEKVANTPDVVVDKIRAILQVKEGHGS